MPTRTLLNNFWRAVGIAAVLASGAPLAFSLATSEADIAYPVAELGKCADREACFQYCEVPDNYAACFRFAKQHNLLRGDLAEREEEDLEELASALKEGGPGGCQTEPACKAYCDDIGRMDECLAFAEEHGFISDDELVEARKVRTALERGATLPGGCRSKGACEAYCKDSDEHTEECFAFAEKAGFMKQEEREHARKFIELMKSGETPGGCRNQRACEEYCSDSDHGEECFAFAEKAGFVPPEEQERFREMQKKFEAGGPGGCKSHKECEAYCREPSHREECEAFFGGFGDQGGAPGGPPDTGKFLERIPAEIRGCIQSVLSEEELRAAVSGRRMPEIEQKMGACFRQFGESQSREAREGERGGGGEGGRMPSEMPSGFEPPPAGESGREPSDGHPSDDQYRAQYEEQYRQQYENQYRQEYEQQYQQQYGQQYREQYQQQYDQQSQQQYQEYQQYVPPSTESPLPSPMPSPSPFPSPESLQNSPSLLDRLVGLVFYGLFGYTE